MAAGEVLHADQPEWPLYHAVLYGSRINSVKFSKRLYCAVILDGSIFLEGLVQAEATTASFASLLASEG